jgi:hypothetical protein
MRGSAMGVGVHLGRTIMVLLFVFCMLPPFRSECCAYDQEDEAADAQDERYAAPSVGFVFLHCQSLLRFNSSLNLCIDPVLFIVT